MRPEEELLVRYARTAGPAAADELARKCGPELYRTALGVLGDAHEAEDAAQEAVLGLLRGARTYRPGGSLRAWLGRLAVNAARDRMRARARHARVEKEGAMQRGRETEGREELAGAVRAAVARLAEPRRSAVVLVYFQGLSRQEAAGALGVPVGTVSSALARAKKDLRARLAGAGALAIGLSVEGLDSMLGALPLPNMPARVGVRLAEAARSGLGAKATASTAAAAKGGVSMKVVAGVIAAGTLAGAVAVSTGMGRAPAPLAAMPEVKENPISKPYDREEIFEFTQKPSVKKEGGKVVISFASKGKCDATVAVVDGKGKIVRHLASGVLGANAPWPFKQNSLSQSVEWDGLDDQGKKAPAGCKVRVSLGLKASYGLTLAYAPHHFYPFGVACDREGNAYVTIEDRLMGDHNIRVFSREGEYVRTILPQPGGLETKEYTAAFDVHGPAGAPFLIDKPDRIGRLVRGMGMAVSSKDLLVFSDSGYRVKKYLYSIRTDGTGLTRGPQLGPWQMVVGRGFLAFNKDEARVYVSGVQGNKKESLHCVFRFGLTDETPKEWRGHDWGPKVPIFVGDKDNSGDDNAHFNRPCGVDTDADGNVYVCDFGNNRVQVFGPDAKYLRTIKIDRPDQVQIHRKTGNLYVLVPGSKAWNERKPPPSKIVKLSPEGKTLAVFEFPGRHIINMGWVTSFTLDDSADPPILWITNTQPVSYNTTGLWRVADKGASFEKLDDVARYELWDPWRDSTSEYIAVDAEDQWVYMKNVRLGGYANGLARFDVATGKRDGKWRVTGKFDEKRGSPKGKLPNRIDEQFVGPDGLLYIRGCVPSTKGDPEYVWRVDPETGKEVPFPAAKDGRIQYPGWHSPKFHRDGFSVGPNGDVYVIWHINAQHSKFKIDAWRGGPLILSHYGADGALKREDVLPGIPYGSCGVQADRAGNLYTGLLVQLADKPYPELLWGLPEAMESFKRRSRVVSTTIGTLCKFEPGGGKIERKKDGGWSGKWGRDPGTITGLKASYVGIGKFGKGCVCRTCRFDLDGFDRAFAPVADLACVMVLDANFNRVARIGRYGNADNRGPESVAPQPEIGLFRPSYVTTNDKALYIADRGNLRVLKTLLGYETEETVPLP